jgi:hypothetical protein
VNRALLLPLLGIIACLLLVTIGIEILVPSDAEPELASPGSGATPDAAAAPSGQGASAAQSAQWVATILARPLFAVSRKPDSAPAGPGPVVADEAANDLPRLSGIFVDRGSWHAMFQPTGDVPPLVVGQGEKVSGWQVDKIELTSVTLSGPKGQTTVEPKFDENAVPPPPQMPAILPKPARLPPPAAQQPPGAQPGGRPNVAPPQVQPQQHPVPGQPTAVPSRPPFIPQQRSVPMNGPPTQPGAH